MVILKVGKQDQDENQIEIVSERGVWGSGIYNLFKAKFLNALSPREITNEPTDKNDPSFLGEIHVDSEREKWEYKGNKLNASVLKEIADFILDYKAPDAVY
ncbi:hypothetical protein FPZ43_02880 [Mucilaginibacter pallidiroseus]|uniref:Uncharacterized protein n=1 Tax=Mucilaginibacter pallidiroseus TaxID=2599295 RepID=A0A563UJ92_9SPHI|nr:hypothetical protein [Mucilaginibacter pallidiroseus]TWR31437.1 hypothetical protein FPZ43_02880 [Mucilaginibacter pallidiroseus]